MNLVFAFCEDLSAVEVLVLCSLQTICLEFFSPCLAKSFSLNLSLSKNIGDKETRSLTLSLWAFASIFYWHYEHSWLNCKCTPWLVLLQYVINVFFFSVFSYSVCVLCLLGGSQIGWIILCACFKAQGVLFIGEKYINASAKSLEDLSSTLPASTLPHLNCDRPSEVQMWVAGQCNISACRSGFCFCPSTLATVLPSCPCYDMAGSVVTTFIIQSYQ